MPLNFATLSLSDMYRLDCSWELISFRIGVVELCYQPVNMRVSIAKQDCFGGIAARMRLMNDLQAF